MLSKIQMIQTSPHARTLYNFALGVAPFSISAYISSISGRYFFAVCGRLSFNLHKHILSSANHPRGQDRTGKITYVGVKSSFSIVNGSASTLTALTCS